MELKCKVCGKLKSEDSSFYVKAQLCNKHYLQLNRYGKFLDNLPSITGKIAKVCSVCGDTEHKKYRFCTVAGEYYGKEMCGKHINQMYHKGKITDPTPSLHIPKEEWTQEEIDILIEGYKNGEPHEIIAERTGHSKGSISCKAAKLGLPDLYISKYSVKFKAVYQDYDWLKERYIDKLMSASEIAEECGASTRVIEKWCEKHRLNQTQSKREIKINDKQRELIMFSLLGDGHIDKRETQPVFIVSHAENQKDYLHWKYSVLENLCNTSPTRYESNYTTFGDKTYLAQPYYRLCTRILNDLIPIRTMSKSEIINELTEFGLAIHMLDDASCNNGYWALCYAGFTDKEKELYRKVLKDKFDIEARLHKDDRYIGFGKDDSQKISNIILRQIPNDLDIIQYKILKGKIA